MDMANPRCLWLFASQTTLVYIYPPGSTAQQYVSCRVLSCLAAGAVQPPYYAGTGSEVETLLHTSANLMYVLVSMDIIGVVSGRTRRGFLNSLIRISQIVDMYEVRSTLVPRYLRIDNFHGDLQIRLDSRLKICGVVGARPALSGRWLVMDGLHFRECRKAPSKRSSG